MNFGFWKQLQRPVLALAPISGYTDAAFRIIMARYGKPDVMWTAFVPAEGLCSPGRDNLMHHLWKTEAERPIVAQLYGGKPGSFRGAAELVAGLGFDGIDINMGCPARAVEGHGGGAVLMKDPKLAADIIEEAKAGAGALPVSVKTRLGYSGNELETWLPALVDARPAAIIIHGRIREEGCNVPARWDMVQRAMAIVRELAVDPEHRPLIIGNGDVTSRTDACAKAEQAGCDGVMVGRAVYGNPWFFNPHVNREDLPVQTVLEVMLEHTAVFMMLYGGLKPLEIMKKHIKAYANGFTGAAELRARLMKAGDYDELSRIVDSYLQSRHAL